MPAIRDWSFNYNTSTTATTISCPLPQYQQNDLLLAILSADSGTQTWSATGWTQLFSQINGANLAVMYKIAGASETDPTFTYTVAETANATLLSIMDVDTSTPIANYATANGTAANVAMPTTTATRNNSLVIFCSAHASTAVVPSIIQGPVTQITAKDGTAHSDSIAWGFMPSSGTTPSNIIWSVSGTTYTSKLATIVINSPSTGATVIPTYCAADNSVFIDPIHGTTAYKGNSAWAGNALTYFTSPLAELTLANATVSARADYGINSYRSCGGMTGPTTATSSWLGATLVLATANKPNVTGKNILLHAMPLLPADIQTVDGVNLGRGIAVGMFSSANNAKTWHVHGAGTPWGVSRAPVVINEANTSGLIDTRGTFNATSVLGFACFTSGFLVSSDWTWTMIWMLDTTVIAGGNASNPIDITGIRVAAADGHERMSVVQQGKNELLVLQPLQFGDGGTNPTYLYLDSTSIEFPEIYNRQKRQVYYCSAPNVAGLTYYAGPNDTIIHKNSIVSSASPFHFRLHASSSTSATYDFSGLSVIGAGDIVLNKAITISEITINNYQTLDISNLTLNNSTITNPPDSNNSITLNSSTTLSGCSISVTTLSAGNYLLSTATPNQFSNCSFNGSASSGHAIRITAPGTYTFSGNIFSNFGADGSTSAAIFNDSGGLVTLNITGGGNTPTVRNGTGASTTINNAVNLTVTVKNEAGSPIQNARVSLQKTTANSMAGAVAYTGTYTNETTAANNATANDMTLMRSSPQVNDAYYFGGKEPFYKLRLNIGTAGAGTWTITWEYYNGSTWATISDVYDPTNGFKAGTGNFNIVFSPPNDWASTTVSGIPAYWIRARVSSFTSITTQPLGTQAWVFLQIMNQLTNSNGVATKTYNYTADEDVYVIIRKSSVGDTKYYPANTLQQITSSGLSLTWTLIQDTIANPSG